MPVYEDLLEWLGQRPAWQQDAIRRLTRGDILPEDVSTLAGFALAEAGGPAVDPGPVPVDASALPRGSVAGPDVHLTGIHATSNLNAIAAGATLDFVAFGLTVVYGDNGSGKSGYVRLLKEVCRARSRTGGILPDVFGTTTGPPRARVLYQIGTEPHEFEWQPFAAIPPELAQVSVFDRACASVYVTAESEVAYRPFGLDLLDALAHAVQAVQADLERGRARLLSVLPPPPPELQSVSPIASFWPLSATTDHAVIEAVPAPSNEVTTEIASTERALAAEDPIARARAARAVRATIERVKRRLDDHSNVVSDERVAELLASATSARDTQSALDSMRAHALANEPLPGTGGETWQRLWSAAEEYSRLTAYPEHEFPNVDPGARCVLCGQSLDEVSAARLLRLRDFVQAELGGIAQQARYELEERLRPFREILAGRTTDEELVAAALEAAPDLGGVARDALNVLGSRANAALQAIDDGASERAPVQQPLDLSRLSQEVIRIETDIRLLELAANPAEAETLRTRLAELRATAWAASWKAELLGEVDRLRLVEAFRAAIASCDTHPITLENNQLTRRYVTAALQDDVSAELSNLNARRIRVQLAWRGERAVSYHRFELQDATHAGARVDDVVSEGEFGALAVAAFLAEVRQQDGHSTIVLDDPVSSLDHLFRSRVAARLAEEAGQRPVVVFTHDLVFLHELQAAAEARNVPIHMRHLRVAGAAVGLPADGTPWRAMSVGTRVVELRRRIERLRELHSSGDTEGYEAAAREWYGALREAWERAVEEVLFGGVVVRYRHDVQTLRLVDKRVWVVEEADIAALNRGMDRSSAWLRGHDQPLAVNEPLPVPDDLEQDLLDLARWIQSLNTRRRADRQQDDRVRN